MSIINTDVSESWNLEVRAGPTISRVEPDFLSVGPRDQRTSEVFSKYRVIYEKYECIVAISARRDRFYVRNLGNEPLFLTQQAMFWGESIYELPPVFCVLYGGAPCWEDGPTKHVISFAGTFFIGNIEGNKMKLDFTHFV